MKHVYVLLLFMIGVSGCGIGRGEDGVHTGVISDVSKAGWFVTTYEGQIMSGSGNSAHHYNFTITNEQTYKTLQEALSTGRHVLVHYYSPRFFSLFSSSHTDFVDSAELK